MYKINKSKIVEELQKLIEQQQAVVQEAQSEAFIQQAKLHKLMEDRAKLIGELNSSKDKFTTE